MYNCLPQWWVQHKKKLTQISLLGIERYDVFCTAQFIYVRSVKCPSVKQT